MQPQELPLDQINPGHDAQPPINVRRVGRDADIAELAASISAHGLIQALAVRQIDDRWYVADGNRRLAALQLLANQNELLSDALIRCDECDLDQDAEEISLAANIMRAPLHEADQYETFRDLADRGLGEAEIAARFGIEAKRVRRILAIGRLSPVILTAWRLGKFDREGVGTVRAFTLASTLKDQVRVFKKLDKDGRLYPHIIRHEFGAGDRDARKFLTFVGNDAYTAAGGTVVEDLFEEDHAISDGALAARLAHEKLVAKRDELIADGWSWAELVDDMPSDWRWNWDKIKNAKKKASKATKAKSGCVVRLDYDGNLDVTYGVVRPTTAKKQNAGATGGDDGDKPAPKISNSLHERLSIQATTATNAALTKEPRLGLVALLAGFVANIYGAPVKVRMDGMASDPWITADEDFAAAFKRLQDFTDEQLFGVAAGIAGNALDLRRQMAGDPIFDVTAADPLAAAIDDDAMSEALREAFDAEDYFKSAPKPIIAQAIEEAINADEARNAGKMKKAGLVEYAVANVPSTGWLPPELRPSTYDGPGASGDP